MDKISGLDRGLNQMKSLKLHDPLKHICTHYHTLSQKQPQQQGERDPGGAEPEQQLPVPVHGPVEARPMAPAQRERDRGSGARGASGNAKRAASACEKCRKGHLQVDRLRQGHTRSTQVATRMTPPNATR